MGSSNLLDGRPAPVSEVGWFVDSTLEVRCQRCNKGNHLQIAAMMRRHKINPRTRIYEVGERLRCATCNGPGTIMGVRGWKR